MNISNLRIKALGDDPFFQLSPVWNHFISWEDRRELEKELV